MEGFIYRAGHSYKINGFYQVTKISAKRRLAQGFGRSGRRMVVGRVIGGAHCFVGTNKAREQTIN
jgi:hypothetical protein